MATTKWDISPWQRDNNKAITKTNVGEQDNTNFEDFVNDPGSAIKASVTSFLKSQFPGLNLGGSTDTESCRPVNTVKESDDEIGREIKSLKMEKYKTINISSVNWQLNNYIYMLVCASGMLVGTLGRSVITNAAEDAVSTFGLGKLATGLGTASIIEKLIETIKNAKESRYGTASSIPSLKNLLEAVASNFFTILSNKPGLNVRATNNTLDYVTNTDGLVYTQEEWDNYVQNFLYTKTGNGSQWSAILANGNIRKPLNWNSKLNGLNTIIPKSRSDREVDISDVMVPYKSRNGDDQFGFVVLGNFNNYEPSFSRVVRSKIYDRVNNVFREIGGLYVEPFYNSGMLKCFEIPFEFNPEISDGGSQAEYAKEQILGRVLGIRSYINTDSNDITIETKYIALADKKRLNKKSVNFNEEGAAGAATEMDQWVTGWMTDWTTEYLRLIERRYRALVYPSVIDGEFTRPPIIRIKMRTLDFQSFKNLGAENKNISVTGNGYKGKSEEESLEGKSGSLTKAESYGYKIGDLFKYPDTVGKLQITKQFNQNTREKRYVATSVTISPLESWSNSYIADIRGISDAGPEGETEQGGANSMARYGFSVTITLSETTKNFLDVIPSYYEYIQDAAVNEEEPFMPPSKKYKIVGDDVDVAGCLNELATFSFKDINSIKHGYEKLKNAAKTGFGTIMYYKEKIKNGVSSVKEEIEELSIQPNEAWNNFDTWEKYLKEMKIRGIKVKSIIKFLKGSRWEKEGKKYLQWLWSSQKTGDNTFTEFDGNWEDFKMAVIEAGFSRSEIIKNVMENSRWKEKEEFAAFMQEKKTIETVCRDKLMPLAEYLQTFFEKDGKFDGAKIISGFKNTSWEDEPEYITWLSGGKSKGAETSYSDKFGFKTWEEYGAALKSAGYSADDIDYFLSQGIWGNYKNNGIVTSYFKNLATENPKIAFRNRKRNDKEIGFEDLVVAIMDRKKNADCVEVFSKTMKKIKNTGWIQDDSFYKFIGNHESLNSFGGKITWADFKKACESSPALSKEEICYLGERSCFKEETDFITWKAANYKTAETA